MFATAITSLGAISHLACAADIEPVTKAAICAIAVIGTVVAAFSGVFRALFGGGGSKDNFLTLGDPRLPSRLVHHFPQIEGLTTLSQIYSNYSGTPILVANSPCYDPGCHEVYYSSRLHSTTGKILHKLSVVPRRLPSDLTKTKRQDEQASGQQQDLYGDYLFINDNPTDEKAEGYDGDFPANMERASDMDIFANTGIFCFNIEDMDDGGQYGSAGYLSLSEPNPFQDPDNEDAYINQCNNSH